MGSRERAAGKFAAGIGKGLFGFFSGGGKADAGTSKDIGKQSIGGRFKDSFNSQNIRGNLKNALMLASPPIQEFMNNKQIMENENLKTSASINKDIASAQLSAAQAQKIQAELGERIDIVDKIVGSTPGGSPDLGMGIKKILDDAGIPSNMSKEELRNLEDDIPYDKISNVITEKIGVRDDKGVISPSSLKGQMMLNDIQLKEEIAKIKVGNASTFGNLSPGDFKSNPELARRYPKIMEAIGRQEDFAVKLKKLEQARDMLNEKARTIQQQNDMSIAIGQKVLIERRKPENVKVFNQVHDQLLQIEANGGMPIVVDGFTINRNEVLMFGMKKIPPILRGKFAEEFGRPQIPRNNSSGFIGGTPPTDFSKENLDDMLRKE